MIDNTVGQQSKKDKRKKRKRDALVLRSTSVKGNADSHQLAVPARDSLHLRSASASDAQSCGAGAASLESQKHGRPDSAPDNAIAYFGSSSEPAAAQYDGRIQILAMNESRQEETTMRAEGESIGEGSSSGIRVTLEDDSFEKVRIRGLLGFYRGGEGICECY